MKTIHWKTIEPQKIPENSIWVKCQGSKLASEKTFADLTEKFPLKPAKQMVPLNKKKGVDLKVIDVKSAQNILISLHGLLKNTSHDQIKQSILLCDTSILEHYVVQQLIKYLPPPSQIAKLQELKSIGIELSDVEKFVATLGEVQDLVDRLHSISFKFSAKDKVEDVKQNIMTVMAACEDIKTSKKFAKILELILELGNYMNSGSRNDQAYGFEISSLTKLMDTKDINNKKSFLHFVVGTIAQKSPELLNFGEEIPHTEKAACIRLRNISDIIDEMTISLGQLKLNLEKFNKPQSTDDKYVEKMADFTVEIDELMTEVIVMMGQMKDRYAEVIEYYALEAKTYPMEKFLGEIKSFKEMFARAHKENTMVGQLIQTRHTHDQAQLQNSKTVNHPDEQEKKAMATLHALQRHKKTIRKLCREFTLKFTRLTKAGL